MDCLFCKIATGDIPAKITYEDELVICFDDINPQAPVHKLIIPRQHIATINDIREQDEPLVGHMIATAANIAKDLGIADKGYRTGFNCNTEGGQMIYHIHLHLLGGRQMAWPPG